MFLKDLRVNDTIPREHGPDKLSRARPHFPICDEDAIPQELPPLFMEGLSFTKVTKLARQHGLDVLRVCRHDYPIRNPRVELCGLGVVDVVCVVGDFDHVAPVFHIAEGFVGLTGFGDEIDCCTHSVSGR